LRHIAPATNRSEDQRRKKEQATDWSIGQKGRGTKEEKSHQTRRGDQGGVNVTERLEPQSERDKRVSGERARDSRKAMWGENEKTSKHHKKISF